MTCEPSPSQARSAPPEALRCDVCGAPAIEIHCRITCTACGYERDCADP